VTSLSPVNTAAMQTLSIGSHTLTKLDEGDGIVWMFDGQPVPSANVACNFEIGHNASCVYVGETMEGTSFTLSVNLKFE
jgi:hypothetical protein